MILGTRGWKREVETRRCCRPCCATRVAFSALPSYWSLFSKLRLSGLTQQPSLCRLLIDAFAKQQILINARWLSILGMVNQDKQCMTEIFYGQSTCGYSLRMMYRNVSCSVSLFATMDDG